VFTSFVKTLYLLVILSIYECNLSRADGSVQIQATTILQLLLDSEST